RLNSDGTRTRRAPDSRAISSSRSYFARGRELHQVWRPLRRMLHVHEHVINVHEHNVVEDVKKLNGGKGVDYILECSGAPNAVNEAVYMVNRGGKVCLAAFPHERVPVDVAHIVRNNIYLYGIRGEGKSATHRAEAFMRLKRFDATKIHTHSFALDDL